MNLLLKESIDRLLANIPPSKLKEASDQLSKIYKQGLGSAAIFQNPSMRLVYLVERMSATYSAITQVLEQIPVPFAHQSWLDLGAGPGSASWAAASLFEDASQFTMIEAHPQAIALGKELAQEHPQLNQGTWICKSLPTPLPNADVAVISYALGEIKQPQEVLESWWTSQIPLLIIIEPGTPKGFALIRSMREWAIRHGASIVAPCPHKKPCPMAGGDWCHFAARLERTPLHRYLKEGSLGYEDEKYSYLVLTKEEIPFEKRPRILRHPQKHSGHVKLTLCSPCGAAEEVTISKKQKELYKKAKDASWGDLL
jgi:ribosomal protein RSM22 (predicted rRNA methylase)